MKTLKVAQSAGFCGGVARALKLAEEALVQHGTCWSLGQIIHNDDAVQRLEATGLHTAKHPEEIPDGATAIIRSHGASRAVIEGLRSRGVTVLDATCPNVRHIQDLASDAERRGRKVLVIGDAKHPEVIGICGWCEDAAVVENESELMKWLEEEPARKDFPLTLVFQTTLQRKIQRNCEFFSKKLCTNAEVFDTICCTTSIRQEEAATLASSCDAMVVIGSPQSANSRHLAEICRAHCNNVQFVANASELDVHALKGADTVGITAGASAPAWIIKEVKQKMCDEIRTETIEQPETVTELEEKIEAEKSFDELLEESIKTIYNGQTVSGFVAGITATEVTIDLGTKHSGYIPVSEFTENTNSKIEDIIHVGDPIEAVVVRVNDVEGTAMLSKKRLDAVRYWADIEAAYENGTVIEGTVTEENKGGVVVSVNGVRVFVPASQSGVARDMPLTDLVGQTVRLKITEVSGRRRIVGSIRAASREERHAKSEKIWAEIEIGKHYSGVVKSMTSYGAFVDIGGVDGMVHVSELSWSKINKPADVVSVGDELDVYVIGFDKEKHKISLGYKDPNANPWVMFTEKCEVGSVVNVRIVKLMPFGAFAEIMPGVDGLIHISQIANRRIGKPEDELSVGQNVDVKITNIDNEKQKVSLSIRALGEAESSVKYDEESAADEPVGPEEDALVYEVSASGEATGIAPEDTAE
ncbi:MAG: bifunctional 4-hydroxy-3-methylbut-2-enyl diphosphate reductase/30S ribosomal protein S1 [Oscillospiraceae bacterium]|nr:bifunctional 4-hydroxy-3-methylbut-2-enyl diphosphate reductase/30S ribosomal protein S1 [Oscillospiraceae bacterium]